MTKKDLEEPCCPDCCEHGECGEEEGEEVYVFTDEEGNEKEFFLAELMDLEQKQYALFLPLDDEEEPSEEEDETAIILRVEQDAEGNRTMVELDDDEELNRVIEAWEASVFEEEAE